MAVMAIARGRLLNARCLQDKWRSAGYARIVIDSQEQSADNVRSVAAVRGRQSEITPAC